MQAYDYSTKQPEVAPKKAIALALFLLACGVVFLTYGALHLAGHVVSTDGAVRSVARCSLLSHCQKHGRLLDFI